MGAQAMSRAREVLCLAGFSCVLALAEGEFEGKSARGAPDL